MNKNKILAKATIAVIICSSGADFVLKNSNETDPEANHVTYYVSTTGDNNNPGTLSQPFACIGHASGEAGPGDKILVRGGTYFIRENIRISCRGTEEQPITIRPYKNELPAINCSGLDGSGGRFAIQFTPGTQYVIFEGFEVTNGNSGILIQNSNNITIRNCTISEFDHFGLSVASDNCLVENNELYRIGMAWENSNEKTGGWPQVMNTYSKQPVPPATISSPARNNVFRGNYIHNSWGEGIDAIFADGVLIENNIIHDVFSVGIYMDCTRNAVVRNNYVYTTNNERMRRTGNMLMTGILMGNEYFGGWADYPPISHTENIYIYNNILSRVGNGIGFWSDTNNRDRKNIYENVKIFNNTVDTYEGRGAGISFAGNLAFPTQGNECKNNIFRSSLSISAEKGFVFENNLWVNGIPGQGNHVNSFTGDPGWIDPLSGEGAEGYRLASGSIAAGKAQPVKGLTTDIFGDQRNTIPTIGAVEAADRITGSPGPATSSIIDVSKQPAPDFLVGVNKVSNPQFSLVEDGRPADWIISGHPDAVSFFSPGHITRIMRSMGQENTGQCVRLGKQGDFEVTLSQTLTGIPDGRYGLLVRVKRFGDGGNFHIELSDFGDESLRSEIPLGSALNEWADYSRTFVQLTISDIEVAGGKCTISFIGSGGKEDYALIDDVCFFRY
jgi:parallel beta-helix repeat protein